MKRKTSTFFLVLAVFNILVAVIPPCVAGFGAVGFMTEMKININQQELGPALEKHIAKEAPLAKIEAFAALGMNTICCLILLGGAAGLFMSQGWARWVSLGGGLCFIFALLIHDVYQIFFYRPVLMSFIDIHVPIHGVLKDGVKFTTTVSTLMWSCTNPLIMLYLFVMAGCMALMSGFHEVGSIDKDGKQDRRLGRKKVDEDEEEEEERPARPRKRRPREED